jgi:integrase/recombinase XerD
MINTHVAKKNLLAIQSLIDSILLNLNKNDKREQISCYRETQLYKQEL